MPIYEFSCAKCRTVFSFFSRRVNPSAVPACPKCGSPLGKMVSLFSARTGGSKSDPDPLGLGDDGLDEDFPNVPDFDPGDERVARAISEMGDRIDRLDPSNPVEASRLLKEFSEKSGVKFNPKLMNAIGKIASGEESEGAQDEIAEAFANGGIFDEMKRRAATVSNDPATFTRDENLYDM